jgi:hypothetical protein
MERPSAILGVEYGFSVSISLDSDPAKFRPMAEAARITLTSFCAHASPLYLPGPDIYGTVEIIKAIRLAHMLGICHVITAEGAPKTAFGPNLPRAQRIFAAIRESLYEPIEWSSELGVRLLSVRAGPPKQSQPLQTRMRYSSSNLFRSVELIQSGSRPVEKPVGNAFPGEPTFSYPNFQPRFR